MEEANRNSTIGTVELPSESDAGTGSETLEAVAQFSEYLRPAEVDEPVQKITLCAPAAFLGSAFTRGFGGVRLRERQRATDRPMKPRAA